MNRIGAICSLYARSRTQDKESTGSKRSLGAVEMQFISLCWIARAVVQSCASMFVRLRASILRKMMQAFLANLGTEFARNQRKNRSKFKKKHEKSIVWTANRPKDKPPSTVSQSTKMASAFKPSFVRLRRPASAFLIESLSWPERVH